MIANGNKLLLIKQWAIFKREKYDLCTEEHTFHILFDRAKFST